MLFLSMAFVVQTVPLPGKKMVCAYLLLALVAAGKD